MNEQILPRKQLLSRKVSCFLTLVSVRSTRRFYSMIESISIEKAGKRYPIDFKNGTESLGQMFSDVLISICVC